MNRTMTAAHRQVLQALTDQPTRVGDLAARLDLPASRLVGILQGLRARGYATSGYRPGDHHSAGWTSTPAGQRHAQELGATRKEPS